MKRMVELACQYGWYGYRRITALLKSEGWKVKHKRAERLWRRDGLKVPSRQPKGKRLWLNDRSFVRLRPQRRNHAWTYDLVYDQNHDGRAFRLLTVPGEYTWECLASKVARRLNSKEVLDTPVDLFFRKRIPCHIRSDNGSEFAAWIVRNWLKRFGVKTLFLEPGSPWKNGYIESFNGKLRDGVLNRESFDTLAEAKAIIASWRREYN